MCGVKIAGLLLVLCVSGFRCSFLFNDTTLASLPPLNRLDDWAQCQRESDVYCMVDAALTSEGPSHLLTLLREFSTQDLKHYNRTQVHRGLCVTRCGAQEEGPKPWHSAAAACLSQELKQYDLQAEILTVRFCQGPKRPEPSANARAFVIFVVVVLALVVLATGVHVLGDRCAKVDGNKYLLAFSMKRNWEILTYDRSKPRTDQRMKDLTAIEGLRVLGTVMVITTHVLLVSNLMYTVNPDFLEKLFDAPIWQMMMVAPLFLQLFFAMSAFITTYSVLITVDKSPITLWKCFLSIVNRYIRLTPTSVIVVWFVMAWYPFLGSGPQWAQGLREADDCESRWWKHLIYVHNHLSTGRVCVGQTWYLAADMQLHVFGVLVLWLMLKWRRVVLLALVAMGIGSGLAAGLVAYYYEVSPIITGQGPEKFRSLFLGSKVVPLLYTPSWMNLAGYAGGMATAFIYHYSQTEGIKLNQKKWFNVLFHLSLPLASAVGLASIVFLWDEPPPHWVGVLNSAIDRPLVTVFLSIFLLGCFTKCKSGLRTFFEWRGFHVLGRLSFSVYLVHYCVIIITTCNNPTIAYISVSFFIKSIISTTVISYVVAVPFCLLFELPPAQLWKALTERGREREREPAPPAEPAKPLDLLANVRRRHDVC